MTDAVRHHYESLLAPVYLWMAGGAERAFALGADDLAGFAGPPGRALDLGAGFGMHAVPLARAGWRVTAVDSSPTLLAELARLGAGLAITAHEGDLAGLDALLPPGERADLVLCMGDTLTHLPRHEDVSTLCGAVAARLAPGGRFVATIRDYTAPPTGDARFIPVRADDTRILTCFLEADDGHVTVHDLLHERADGAWRTRVSSYRKLRLAPAAVRAACEAAGLTAEFGPGPRGMVRLVAVR